MPVCIFTYESETFLKFGKKKKNDASGGEGYPQVQGPTLCVFINQVCECYSLSTAPSVQSPWTLSEEIFIVTTTIATK